MYHPTIREFYTSLTIKLGKLGICCPTIRLLDIFCLTNGLLDIYCTTLGHMYIHCSIIRYVSTLFNHLTLGDTLSNHWIAKQNIFKLFTKFKFCVKFFCILKIKFVQWKSFYSKELLAVLDIFFTPGLYYNPP